MARIAIIVGSVRPGRRADQVAAWVAEVAAREATQPNTTFELVDLARVGLPLLDEPVPAIFGRYAHPHTRRWAEAVASYDGFVFVTPEYNHGLPASVKNAIDFLFAEWNDKVAGFVGYGIHGGTRAVEQLRLVLAEVKVATVRTQVALSLFTDFQIPDPTEPGIFAPAAYHEATLVRMLGELRAWAEALRGLRDGESAAAAAAR